MAMARSISASASAWSWVACSRSSRHIFQHTHSSRKPPASSRPTMASSWTVMSASPMRMTTAAARPIRMALRRCSWGRAAAARPTATALSPARTRSIISTLPRAEA
jgi:hypothetical protein